jgi:hypothetical protein
MVKTTNQKIWACLTCPKVGEMIVLGLYQEVETIDVSLHTHGLFERLGWYMMVI